MRCVLTGLLAFSSLAGAQEWKSGLEVFDAVRTMQAPQGYQVLASPGGSVIKDVSQPEPVNIKAVVELQGKRYYMSDWSWSRYRGGHQPYWILVRGEEEPEKPAAPPQEPAPAAQAQPLSGAEKLERKWDGVLEVFPASRDVPAPQGYKLLAEPDRKQKPLRSTGTRTSISVQAALTRKDGHVYYISDWSWSRVQGGHEPNWMFITGSEPRTPSGGDGLVRQDAGPAPVQKPAPAQQGEVNPGAASLVEKVKQMVRPKLAWDGVEASGRVVALLVGNGRYSSANRTQQMLDLADPPLNVDLLARALRALNVEVREEKDQNREQLGRAVQETVAGLRPGDVFLFYYAGHALQLGGENYLVPLGINFLDRSTVRNTAYGLNALWETLSGRSLRFAAVWLDGCRKNPFNTKDAAFYILSRIPGLNLAPDAGNKPGLMEEKPRKNLLISFAAEPGTVMADSAPEGGPSRYAAALASALVEDLEIRQVMELVQSRVSEWTGRRQQPWVAAGDGPRFYLRTPGRWTLEPDEAVAQAGEWLFREQEKGLPIALGLLARSVRERPGKNPATAALLFLLSHQAIPVPKNRWGPFPAREDGYAGELQLSIDGRYVALFPAKGEKPGLILDREKGRVVSEVYESFAPGYGDVLIRAERMGPRNAEGSGELPVICFQRKPEKAGPDKEPEMIHALTPLLPQSPLVASFYDEGLERVFLALQDGEKTVTFWEYGTTPPVGCREDFRLVPNLLPDPAKAATEPLAAGVEPEDSEGPAQSWSLVFDAPSDEVRFLRGTEVAYRRAGVTQPGRRLDDWRLDANVRRLALVFCDHVDVLGLNGAIVSQFDLPPVPGAARKILSFNPAFRRLALAWGPVPGPGDEGRQEIAFVDLFTGQRTGGREPLMGYADFAGLSSNQEWFFYYDAARRIRLVDMVSGGARIHLAGTATLQALPVGAGLEPKPESDAEFPRYELRPPPLEGLGGPAAAPAWLAELAEALIGFKVNEGSEVEWIEDASKRLESVVQQMRKRPGDDAHQAWAQWLLENRLGVGNL